MSADWEQLFSLWLTHEPAGPDGKLPQGRRGRLPSWQEIQALLMERDGLRRRVEALEAQYVPRREYIEQQQIQKLTDAQRDLPPGNQSDKK